FISLKQQLQAQLDFSKVVLNTQKEAEEKLMVLEGWVPQDNENDLKEYLEKSGVYYEMTTAGSEEMPPIKLKNNRFSKLYEPIGELYTFPNYREIDLTPFLPIYMLFFGFCLGDVGYGLLILIGTLIGLKKVKPAFKPLMKLGMYLGIATIIMGALGGTVFGIMLLDKQWPWLEKYKAYMLDNDKLMILALGLGYLQVIFGMVIKAANKIKMEGFKYSISLFGWIIIVMFTIPSLLLVFFKIISFEEALPIVLPSGIIGGIPAFFYNTPGKNPLLNIGVGLWDTYQTASGLLGDVLSYIRLFALGLSSAILGSVFNTLALTLSPDIPVVGTLVMIFILLFGHSLNFFMAMLGSFVHPLRLTFVEFYKNAGFMGGGKKYNPFGN
ncbi:MAG: ATPase, partial [Bacteroidales bacterium]|nr:ATPase [Bacteroidales bacterium]